MISKNVVFVEGQPFHLSELSDEEKIDIVVRPTMDFITAYRILSTIYDYNLIDKAFGTPSINSDVNGASRAFTLRLQELNGVINCEENAHLRR